MDSCFTHPMDFEWRELLQRYAFEKQYFLKIKRMTEDEPMEDIGETETSEEDPAIFYQADIERSQAFLMEAVSFLSLQAEHPKANIIFLLDFATVLARDESSFIKLNTEKVFQQLISISKPTVLNSDEDIKFIFLGMLNAFLLHPSGVKWITETNYYVDVYKNILQYQKTNNERVLNLGYSFLTTLLEKTIEENQIYTSELLKFLSGPILLTLQDLKLPSSMGVTVYRQKIYDDITYHGTCLVEILERLIKNRSTQVLDFLLELRVREAADNIALISDDPDFTITMYRILMILSLYELNELFNGIKVINQNILDLSGINRIVGRELEKSNICVIIEIIHYAIKYSKSEGFNLPKYILKDQLVDIESECMAFQCLPAYFISEYLGHFISCCWEDLEDFGSFIRINVSLEIARECSVKTIYYAYQMRTIIMNRPVEVFIKSMDILIKTKSIYSKEKLNRIAIVLVCALEDVYGHFKEVTKFRLITYEEQMLVEKLIEIIVDIIETPDLCLDNKVKCIDIPTIIHHFLYTISWPSPVVIKGLRLLKLIVTKHMSPSMLLLIDSIKDTALADIGHMLFVKLFTSDWEVRQVALNVITTISHTANRSFPSFREILVNASLPEVVLVLSIEDRNPLVRAAAFKSLQEIFVISDIDEKLRPDEVTEKVLASIQREIDSFAKKEAVKLISVIYWHNKDTEHYPYLKQMYKCLEQVAYSDKNYLVQQEVLNFWKMVELNHMRSIGWTDESFPPIIFSKKIIRMTNKEVEKRIFKVLKELSDIGCLDVIKYFWEYDNLSEEVSKSLDEWLHRFYETYRRYQVTELPLTLYETYLEDSSLRINLMPPTQEAIIGSDEFMELLDEFIPKIEETPEYKELMSTSYLSDILQKSTVSNRRMSPSQFVHLIYDMKRGERGENGETGETSETGETEQNYNDVNYVLEY